MEALKTPKAGLIALFLFLVFAYFPFFLHLDSYCVKNWDEALFGMRALSIYETGTPLENFKQYADFSHHNHKPAMFSYVQAAFLGLIGKNNPELAMRLPVALTVFIGMLLIQFFMYQREKSWLLPALFGLILITSMGFIRVHCTRTGDQDGVLSVFLLFSLWHFGSYLWSSSRKKQFRHLIYLAIFIFLAYNIKSLYAFVLIPGMLVFVLLDKRRKQILTDKRIYFVAAGLLVAIIAKTGLVELMYPGYHGKVNEYVYGRFWQVVDDHRALPYHYYMERLLDESFFPWIYFIPFGLGSYIVNKGWKSDLAGLCFWAAFIFELILGFSSTKLNWYDSPVYPLLAIVAALGIEQIILNIFNKNLNISNSLRAGAIVFMCCLFLVFPYRESIKYVYKFQNEQIDDRFGDLMNRVHSYGYRDYYVLSNAIKPQVGFYKSYFNIFHDGNIKHRTADLNFIAGDKVLLCENSRKKILNQKFKTKPLDSYRSCEFVEIVSRKE